MVHDLELKRRSYSRLKTNAQSISGNFAAAPPFRRMFRSCEITLWHMSATLQCRTPISQLRSGLRKSPSSTKSSPCCGNDLQASKMGCDLLFYVSFFLLATKWIQKWPPSIKMGCEIPIWLFAAP